MPKLYKINSKVYKELVEIGMKAVKPLYKPKKGYVEMLCDERVFLNFKHRLEKLEKRCSFWKWVKGKR